jgi:glutamate-1-semialdehyde aminotransferase
MTDFAMHRKAKENIGQGYLTNSKRPESFVMGVYPTHIVSGEGCKLHGYDGTTYLDFICGLGTNLLGYGNPTISERVYHEIKRGVSHSLASTTEIMAAERLRAMFPFVDRVKFLKTGTEACLAAIRIARVATGRGKILSAGYHGWSDPYISLEGGEGCYSSQIEKLNTLNQINSDVAAVIIEPVELDNSRTRIEYLKALKNQCESVGALLIYDEVITGFRYTRNCVARAYSVEPDLIVLGKAMANGFPLAAVGGNRDLMNGNYFVSSTYAGDTASLAAFLAVSTELAKSTYQISDLWNQGERFLDEFNKLSRDIQIVGYPTRGRFAAEKRSLALFFQEACKAGILFGPSWFYNFHLAEHREQVINTCGAILGKLSRDEIKLEGELPSSPFSQKVRENDNRRATEQSGGTAGLRSGEGRSSKAGDVGVQSRVQSTVRSGRRDTDKPSTTGHAGKKGHRK